MQQIQKFKKTRIGKIPYDWDILDLGKISELFVPMRDKPKQFDGDIPWLRIEDLDGKFATDSKSNQRVSSETVKKMNLRIYPVGTVLCSCSATIGVCSITTRELITNQTFIGIFPNPQLNKEFLYYYLLTQENYLRKIGSGSTIPYISREKFERLPIVLPQIKEQQKIASVLSNVDELIQKTDQIIEQTRILKKGLMQRLLTRGIEHTKYKTINSLYGRLDKIPDSWDFLTVNDLTHNGDKTAIKMGPFGSDLKKNELLDVGEIKTLWIENIVDNKLNLDYQKFITREKYLELKNFTVKEKDVVLSMMGTVGRVAIIPHNIGTAIITSHLLKITLDQKKCLSEFLQYYFLSDFVRNQLNREARGIVMQGLNTGIVKSLKIALPSIEEQKEIVKILNSIELLLHTYEINNKTSKNLKKGLMQQLLTGKIRVKV